MASSLTLEETILNTSGIRNRTASYHQHEICPHTAAKHRHSWHPSVVSRGKFHRTPIQFSISLMIRNVFATLPRIHLQPGTIRGVGGLCVTEGEGGDGRGQEGLDVEVDRGEGVHEGHQLRTRVVMPDQPCWGRKGGQKFIACKCGKG